MEGVEQRNNVIVPDLSPEAAQLLVLAMEELLGYYVIHQRSIQANLYVLKNYVIIERNQIDLYDTNNHSSRRDLNHKNGSL